MPETLPFFPNPAQAALRTTHAHLALTAGKATKYPADVAPFGTIDDTTPEAFHDLHSLLLPNEILYPPDSPIFETHERPAAPTISPLTCADAPTMLALTDIAFPGLFRIRTCEMGSYFGIWQDGQLIAMCGERMSINPWRELSGLCTHPDHRGHGHAARLLAHLIAHNRNLNLNLNSYLHVSASNTNAIGLYSASASNSRANSPYTASPATSRTIAVALVVALAVALALLSCISIPSKASEPAFSRSSHPSAQLSGAPRPFLRPPFNPK